MTFYVKQIEGLAVAARGESAHWVAMDRPAKLGGMESGSRPMEVLLMSLGGCTAMDVISILKKKRAPIDDLRVEVEAARASVWDIQSLLTKISGLAHALRPPSQRPSPRAGRGEDRRKAV